MLKARKWLLLALTVALMCGVGAAGAAEKAKKGQAAPQEWELIIPTGEIEKTSVDPAPRISSLDGKTVALRWNGKNNGDVAMNRLGELLQKKYPTVKIVKIYETDPSTNIISASAQNSQRITDYIKTLKPDLVIGAQAD